MRKIIYLLRILAFLAAMVLMPAAFSQQGFIDPPGPGPDTTVSGACAVFVTGDFESECILPYEKPRSYINEEGNALIACQGMVVNYTAHLAGDAVATGWSWSVTGAETWDDHGDGTITVHWGNGDVGTITVEVTDADGNICTVTRTVMLMERPTARVSTVPSYIEEGGKYIIYVCPGESVEFIDESTLENGDIAGYYWEETLRGVRSTTQNFIVSDIWDKLEVRHRVYNNCGCYDSIIFEVRLQKGKPLELGCYGTVCSGQYVTYTAISPECTTYAWYVEGGTIETGDNSPTVTVHWDNPSSGYGIIGLEGTLCGDGVCQSLMSKKIPILIDGVEVTGQRTACVGEAVEYSVPLYGSTEYSWEVTPNIGGYVHEIQENRIVVVFPSEGTYNISVSYGCDFLGCNDLHSETLTVNVKPRLTVTGDSRICQGSECNLHTVPENIPADWTIMDSVGNVKDHVLGSSTLQYVFDYPGRFRIVAESEDFCHSVEYHLTVVEAPEMPVLGPHNPIIACPHSSIRLTGETNNPAYSLVWEPVCGDATPQHVSGDTVTINYGNTVCDVRVYNYDRILGCLSPAYTHHVSPFQLAEMNVDPISSVCPGTPLNFAADDQEGVIYEWQLEREKQYCASVQGEVYYHQARLVTNELTGTGAYPTTFNFILYRTYCSTMKDTTIIPITIDTIHTEVSIDPIDPVCQGSPVNLSGSCEGGTITWGVSGCEYYTLSGNQVVFDEPGVFTVTMSCNPYFACENQRYIQTASTTVEVVPLPPFAAIVYSNGYVTTEPELSDEEYSFRWGHTQTVSHIVPAAEGETHYTCEVIRQDPLGCSRILEAEINPACFHTDIVYGGYDYCNHTATFTMPGLQPDANVKWIVAGGEYGNGRAMASHEQEITIEFSRLGDYLILAQSDGDPCYFGTYMLTVDFLPSITVDKRCKDIVIYNNSRTLSGTGTLTIECGGQQVTMPVTQSTETIVNMPDGEYTVTLVSYNGHEMSCSFGNVTITNTGGATLSIATEFGDQRACDNTAMKVVVTATPSVPINSVRWTIDDGSALTTTSDHFYHTFKEREFQYHVTATLSDNNGCLSYGSTNIFSADNELKEPDLQNVGTPVCPGNAKTIHYTTDHGEIQDAYYSWEWSDPTTNNNYAVYSTGDYHVTATNDNHCKAMAMTNVRFKNSPQAAIVTDGYIYCVGDEIRFYGSPDPDPSVYQFAWQIERNGNVVATSDEANMQFTPSYAGVYTVRLSITNGEGCSDSDVQTITVNQHPAQPVIRWGENQCIDRPPVNLEGGGYTGELHWSNGHVGATADYYVAGTATAWYYDTETGCRSDDANIYITPAPDFDALLTGCYNICKRDLPNLSPLRVWGLMQSNNSFNWQWYLDNNEIGHGGSNPIPIDLDLPGFGDYRLVVEYHGEHCKAESPILRLENNCHCKDLEVTSRVNSSKIKDCKVEYHVHVTICNRSDEKRVCLKQPPQLVDNNGQVEITSMNFNPPILGPHECYTFLIKLVASNVGGGTVQFQLHDECNDCDTLFVVDLREIKINCDSTIRMDKFRLVEDITSPSVFWFNFHAALNNVQAVLALWAEPDIVVNYDFVPWGDLVGLAAINVDTLLNMASEGKDVCFHAIVCKGKKLCRVHFCINAKELYSQLMRNRTEESKGAKAQSHAPAETQLMAEGERLTLHPNPANGIVTVSGQSGKVTDVTVMDMQGRRAAVFVNTDSFDVSGLPKGQYIVRVTTDKGTINTHYLKLVKK